MTTKQFKEKHGVHISTRLSGKMHGIPAISTSSVCNAGCAAMAGNARTVCNKCYSRATLESGRRQEAARVYETNTQVLTATIIPPADWPIINARYIRLESHGDLNNVAQMVNYINFARRNSKSTVTLWTKRPAIVAAALKDHSKPRNLIIIYSSPFVDRPVDVDKVRAVYPFVDKVFTVYSRDYIQSHDITINCGARNCLDCGRCYRKGTARDIRERLK